MSDAQIAPAGAKKALAGEKFQDPDFTADGQPRAQVAFQGLQTLWVNTGTQCNIECLNCYIESSPANDRLVYLRTEELTPFLEEAARMGAGEIGFTGGEPFLNPDMADMTEAALSRGFRVLILTNAMRPMMRPRVRQALKGLLARYGEALALRVSIDHFTQAQHDEERGAGGFADTMEGMRWLAREGFALSVAGRLRWRENEAEMREGFAALFAQEGLAVDAHNPQALVLFPEMDENAPVPEITEACWGVLGKRPDDVMCASSRMIVKRKGADAPAVLACTLIPYDRAFELGRTLNDAAQNVSLNHPHCAKFCVLGGASCSG